MTVNGWMGLAFDLRRADESEHELAESRRDLRRAFQNATHFGPGPAEPSEAAELRRATVEVHQAILRHAVRTGQVDLVRRSGRHLRLRDFAGEPSEVEGLLGALRDARTPDGELLETASRLAALHPAPC